MADVQLKVTTIVDKAVSDLKKVDKGIAGVDKAAAKASKSSKQFTDALLKFAGIGGAMVMIQKLANAVKKFAAESLEAASRAEELKAKFDTVFGKSAPEATRALEEFGDAVHRSNLDLQEMAAETQNVLVATGLARDVAADYSIDLTKLAVDVAAFNNAQDVDVMNAFRSAMVGVSKPVMKYGIDVRAAAVNSELLKMGIVGGTKAATEAQIKLARYNILMNATADSHGAAAKEADSYTNVTKGLEAAMTDLHVAVGEQLLPTMTKWKVFLTEVITNTAEMVETENLLREAHEVGIVTTQDYNAAINHTGLGHKYTKDELVELIAAYEEENDVIVDTKGYLEELTIAENNYAGAVRDVESATKDLEKAQQSWLQSTANEVVAGLKDLDISSKDYKNALVAIDDMYGTSEVAEQEHKDKIDEIVDAYGKDQNILDFKNALQGLKDAELPQTTDALETARSKAEELYDIMSDLKGLDKITIEVEYVQTGDIPDILSAPVFEDPILRGETMGGGDTSNSVKVYGDLYVNSSGGLSEMDVLSEVRI